MVLRQEVINVVSTRSRSSASLLMQTKLSPRAYKKLALLHHPDRIHRDATSTARFQEVCLLHAAFDTLA
jgi:hypothetical protein